MTPEERLAAYELLGLICETTGKRAISASSCPCAACARQAIRDITDKSADEVFGVTQSEAAV